jgi:ferredoxin/DNA-binding MarR family transcriptional regulator
LNDAYEALRRKMNLWPIRTPRTDEIMEILHMLYTEEEADFLADTFSAPYQDVKTCQEIADKANMSQDHVLEILDSLAERGLVFRFPHWKTREVCYALLPLVPGLFEFYFSGLANEEQKEKLAYLFEKAYKSGLAMEAGPSDYPWERVIPIEKTLQVSQEILPFERVSEFIKTAHKIAVIPCACRTKHPCEHPVETCIVFDSSADFMVGRGIGTYLTVEEALALLEEMEKAGLVHTTTNSQRRPQFICNCCTCSCLILRGLTEMHNPRAFAISNFVAQKDDDTCTLCKTCIEVCPFDCYYYHYDHDDEPEKIGFNPERCVGCGLCSYHCPAGAITLVKVRNKIPEVTARDAWLRVEKERVH